MWDRKEYIENFITAVTTVLSELCGIESIISSPYYPDKAFVLSELCGIESILNLIIKSILAVVLSELCGIESENTSYKIFYEIEFCLNYVG